MHLYNLLSRRTTGSVPPTLSKLSSRYTRIHGAFAVSHVSETIVSRILKRLANEPEDPHICHAAALTKLHRHHRQCLPKKYLPTSRTILRRHLFVNSKHLICFICYASVLSSNSTCRNGVTLIDHKKKLNLSNPHALLALTGQLPLVRCWAEGHRRTCIANGPM